jgi:hypothetical protein
MMSQDDLFRLLDAIGPDEFVLYLKRLPKAEVAAYCDIYGNRNDNLEGPLSLVAPLKIVQ